MSQKTNIAWCDSTLNFWSGCTKVSDGCKNCYAETLSKNKFFGGGKTIGKWGAGAERKRHESAFKLAFSLNRKPLICDGCGMAYTAGWKIPVCCKGAKLHRRRIFSLSLGDWLDDEVPIEWLAKMLDTIRQCNQVVWILCTKRPESFFSRLKAAWKYLYESGQLDAALWVDRWLGMNGDPNPPKSIVLLTSVENQAMADKRIPELLKIPAVCRGLSLEPLLSQINLTCVGNPAIHLNDRLDGRIYNKLDWYIIGGESGNGARACNVDWIRNLVRQGQAAGVATFVKQLGTVPVLANDSDDQCWPGATIPFHEKYKPSHQGEIALLHLQDKKGCTPPEWPVDLRVQQWPSA